MNNHNRLLRMAVALCLMAFLAGCISLKREFPEIRNYTLDPKRESAPEEQVGRGESVVVVAFTASPAVVDPAFFLRRDASRVEKDFYNRFVVPPAKLIQEETASWLRVGGLFEDVRTTPDAEGSGWHLSGHIVRLEGDFTSRSPEAVMAIQFFMRPDAGQEGTSFFRTYEQREPLTSSTPSALVEGWNRGLAKVLENLERDLGNHLSAK